QRRMLELRAAIDLDGQRLLRILRAAGDPDKLIGPKAQERAQRVRLGIAAFDVDAVVLDIARRDDVGCTQRFIVLSELVVLCPNRVEFAKDTGQQPAEPLKSPGAARTHPAIDE